MYIYFNENVDYFFFELYIYIYKYIYIIYTPIIFIIVSVNGMVFSGGLLSRLDILLQKFTLYNHHRK